MKLKNFFAAGLTAATLLAGSMASAATYTIGWTGSNTYTMTGTMTFSDALVGTGLIDETQISELSITVLLNNVILGTRSLIADGLGSQAASFNLNFDTSLEQFATGGFSGGPAGQNWFTSTGGSSCDTIGFSSGGGAQGVCANGTLVNASFIDSSQSTLTANAVGAVPLPAGGLLLLGGLGAFGWVGRRRKAA